LNANGHAKTNGLELSYPIVRTSNFNLTQNLALERKDYSNYSANTLVSNYKNMPVTLGVNGVLLDELGQGSGVTSFSGGLTSGQLNLNSSPTETMDAASTRTAGSFSKFRYALSRHQQLGSGVSLFAAWTGQWAAKNLDSSEKFYLGGITGIRAYPSSEGGGSLGQMLNLEMRFQLPDGLNLVGFYDYGWVQQNVSNEYVGAPKLNHFALKGAGLGLAWRHTYGLSVQATYARRIGQNPSAITTDVNRGADQDGTLSRNRLWITASVAF
jgi:hemolysin activation/secretion protein